MATIAREAPGGGQVPTIRTGEEYIDSLRGRKLKVGRSMAFVEGEVSQEAKMVAKVSVTFALM